MTQFSITINGQPFDSLDHPRLQSALAHAHKQHTTYCQCHPRSPIPLVVKHYNANTPLSSYGLALWPDTGLSHHHDCYFFGENEADESSTLTKPPFEELPSGKSRAYLSTALQIIAKNVRAIEARKTTEVSTVKRRRAGELMLLLKLWRQAGLNIYKGYERRWFHASFQLLKAAANLVINNEGESLDQYLLLGCGTHDKLVCEHNNAVLERTKQRYTRLFVIGRLKSFTPDKQRQMLVLKDFATLPRISVQLDQIQSLFDADPFLLRSVKEDQLNTVIIACIEPGNNNWWTTLHIHALATTPDLLPVNSEDELLFAEHLVSQQRKFLKQIYLESPQIGDQRPQFMLLDTALRTYCEVFSTPTAFNASHVDQTKDRYRSRNHDYFTWHRSLDAIPPLPDKQSQGT